MDKYARRHLRKIADHNARHEDFVMKWTETRKREILARNKEVDRQTLNACKAFQKEILTALREYYSTDMPPFALDVLYPEAVHRTHRANPNGHYINIPYTYVADGDQKIFLPCTHDRHPSDPQAIPVDVLVEAGVEEYKWRMLEAQYFDFYFTMQKTECIKRELLHKANRQACIRACHAIKEELVARVFHPKNLERWIEQGIDEMMFGY